MRDGKHIYVNNVKEARELLDNMPDLRSGGVRQMPRTPDPRGTYRGDLINTQNPTGPIHKKGVGADHRLNPHYNILFHNGKKASIIIKQY